jgi:broad specificity polyphosphatase/5'/3'-nucleotidase SurE
MAVRTETEETWPRLERDATKELKRWNDLKRRKYGPLPKAVDDIPAMPADGYKGYQITSQAAVRAGVEKFVEEKRPGTNQTVYWSVYTEGAVAPRGTDIWAVNNGYVSITPMHVGEYDEKLAVTLRGWFR